MNKRLEYILWKCEKGDGWEGQMFVGEIKEYFRACSNPIIPRNVQTILCI